MNENIITQVKETIEQLLEKMGFPATVDIIKSVDNENGESIICNITTDTDSNFLIGQRGVNLQALQHITRLIVRKKTNEKIHFLLDINSYREQKNQTIIETAQEVAKQALNENRAVMMKPMSTYERRIVHMELAKNSNIKTESIGEGEDRKIVVKPANFIN